MKRTTNVLLRRRAILAGAVLAAAATPAWADRTWDRGAGTNFWTDAANWNPDGLPTSADAAIFTDTGAGTVDLNGASQPASGSLTGLTFNNATTGYTVQNGGSIFTNAITNSAGAAVTNTISARVVTNNITVSSGTLSLQNGSNTINGPVSIAAGAKLDVLAPSSNSIGAVSLNGGTLIVRGGSTTNNNALFHTWYNTTGVARDDNFLGNIGATPNGGILTFTPIKGSNTQIGALSFANKAAFDSAATVTGNATNVGPFSGTAGTQDDDFAHLWTGRYTPPTTGSYTFGVGQTSGGVDDEMVIYIDLNQNGVFENATERVADTLGKGCCGAYAGTAISLDSTKTYKVAIAFHEFGGGEDGSADVLLPGAGTYVALNPSNPAVGAFAFDTVSAANLSGSAITVTADSVVDVQSPTGTLGAITFNTGTNLTVQGVVGAVVSANTLSGTGTATLTTSAQTSTTGLSGFTTFTKAGTNSLTINGPSTGFNGNVVVGAGTLILTDPNGLGTATGNTLVQSGAQLSLRADNVIEPVTINGTGPGGSGALEATGDNTDRTFTGPITLGSDAFIVASTGGRTLTLTGGITNGGFQVRIGGNGNTVVNTTGISGAGGLRKSETGTLTINAASGYTGNTDVGSGTLTFTAPLSGSAAINLTAGTINAGAAVKSGAAVAITGGTYNANAAGALNGTNTVSGAGVLRVTAAVGAGGAVNVTNVGRLQFDGANTGFTTPTNNVNVDSGGIVHARTGIADLSTQNIVVNPLVTTPIPNQLRAVAINLGGTNPDSGANVNTVLGLAPTVTTTLPNASGAANAGAINFPQATGDATFNAFFGQTLNDNFTGYFTGRFTAPTAGTYNFRVTDNDDTAGVAVDLNNNGSFADAGDLTAAVGCCNNDTNTTATPVNVTLAAGQTIGVFYGTRDTGGGSGLVGHFTLPGGADQLVTPGAAGQAGLWSVLNTTGGGTVQVDAGAELQARTVTGATTIALGGKLTLTAGAGLTSNTVNLNPTGGLANLNVGAGHTLTAQVLNLPPAGALPTVLTKTGAGTVAVSGSAGVTLDNSRIVANAGLMDLSNTRLTATAVSVQTGLQGRAYSNFLVDPRNSAANVATILNQPATNTVLLTSANGPNGGLNFTGDGNFATFFNNANYGPDGGGTNFTSAFIGKFTAQVSGTHTFGIAQNDDNTAIFVDANQDGVFQDSEQVVQRGCCNGTGNLDTGTVNLTAGQAYAIAILNEDTGGGASLGAKFQEPAGGAITTATIIAPGAAGQNQFTFSTGGGTLQVDPGATLIVAGTSGPMDLTLNGTLRYVAQGSASISNLNNVTVASSQTGTLDILANQNVSVTGALALGGNLVKSGAGRLAVNITATGTGTVTVMGGTLGGTGSIPGPVNVAGPVGTGGTVAPGNSVGTFGTGNFTITSTGGTVGIELDPTNSGGLGTTDNLNVTGTVTLTGGNLALTLLSTPTVGQTFQIISNDGSDAVVGTFTTANGSTISGNQFNVGGNQFQISYASGTGNDVVLTVVPVPEPAAVGLLGLGAAGLLARRRRRA